MLFITTVPLQATAQSQLQAAKLAAADAAAVLEQRLASAQVLVRQPFMEF